jgi:hypothetical protein
MQPATDRVEQHHVALSLPAVPQLAGHVLSSSQGASRFADRPCVVNQIASEGEGLVNATAVCRFDRSPLLGINDDAIRADSQTACLFGLVRCSMHVLVPSGRSGSDPDGLFHFGRGQPAAIQSLTSLARHRTKRPILVNPGSIPASDSFQMFRVEHWSNCAMSSAVRSAGAIAFFGSGQASATDISRTSILGFPQRTAVRPPYRRLGIRP